MKIRVTIMTENDKPISVLGENPEAKVKKAWELFLAMVNMESNDPSDKAFVENVEIVMDGEVKDS